MDTDKNTHASIIFNGRDTPEVCPRCHRVKLLGKCNDGCKMCQSCYHALQGMGELPSDVMSFAAVGLPITKIEVIEAPGDLCGNTRKLPNGQKCPGCRACC